MKDPLNNLKTWPVVKDSPANRKAYRGQMGDHGDTWFVICALAGCAILAIAVMSLQTPLDDQAARLEALRASYCDRFPNELDCERFHVKP